VSTTADIATAPAVNADHLSGICYAAVETTFLPAVPGVSEASILVTDGNGRQTLVKGIDLSLGMVARHYQALVAHHGPDVTDFTPGYLRPGVSTNGAEPQGQTLVWVLL